MHALDLVTHTIIPIYQIQTCGVTSVHGIFRCGQKDIVLLYEAVYIQREIHLMEIDANSVLISASLY